MTTISAKTVGICYKTLHTKLNFLSKAVVGHPPLELFQNHCRVIGLQRTRRAQGSAWNPISISRCSPNTLQVSNVCSTWRHFRISSAYQASREVPLTSVTRPDLVRGSYSTVTSDDVAYFQALLPQRVATEEDDLIPYNTDWLRALRGASQVLLKPKTTAEVSKIMTYCYDRNLAVVPQGGNTGLVGGSVPVFDEIILSTELMNKIIEFDQLSGVLVCQAGCILENLDHFVGQYGHTMPLDLAAKGSCHIGGNVSTNAGGIRLLRYGSLRGTVLGIEAVLADGRVIDCLSTLRKDNTGYDLKQLFIGSEGTLGIVTSVAILCPPRPQSVNVAFFGCETFSKVLDIYKESKSHLVEILSAFEFMDRETLTCVTQNLDLRNPLGQDCPFYVLMETSGSDGSHDEDKLNRFLEHIMAVELVLDGTVATDTSKIQMIWSLRESINEAIQRTKLQYKYDLTIPHSQYYDIVPKVRDHLHKCRVPVCDVIGYGHVGDGNIHMNVIVDELTDTIKSALEPFVFEETFKMKGSVSSEHGLGLNKMKFIGYTKTEESVHVMQQMKYLFDPKRILNPHKTIPSTPFISS